MEEDTRPFEAVHIGLTSVESGRDRFSRDGLYAPPPLSFWRNNLTALSQRFNLYFVATRDSIAVYKPEFPFQKLHRLPSLLIPKNVANPKARGYLDPRFPHAINHLVVGELGSEEIVLAATDSGNVTAYYTRTIDEVIQKQPYRFSTEARSDYVGLRPFFVQWVYESAWGLSIHTAARMIAVSANTPYQLDSDDPCAKITVFAFALSDRGNEDHEVEEQELSPEADLLDSAKQPEWHDWEAKGTEGAPPARDKNYKITLAGIEGHDHNIPSISFVNSDEDVDGTWLLSTDIAGDMKIWRIWQGTCLKSWDFSERRMRPAQFATREGGWVVAALDSLAFRSARTMQQFCGHTRAPLYHGHAGESYDLTHVVRLHTPGNSHAHPTMYDSTDDASNDNEDAEELIDSWSDLDEAIIDAGDVPMDLTPVTGHLGSADASSNEPPGGSSDHESQIALERLAGISSSPEADAPFVYDPALEASQDGSSDDEDEDVQYDSSSNDIEDEEIQYDSTSGDGGDDDASSGRRSIASSTSPEHRSTSEVEVDVLSASDPESASQGRQHVQASILKRSVEAAVRNARRMYMAHDGPVIPAIHCSVSNLRLLMAPRADSPHVFCANMLKQALPPAIETTNHASLDRLNMLLQIPELGIVLIATQIGRCAICTLTKHHDTGALGLRVDWILPTKRQEVKKLRPFMPLLGIAASPVQGRFKPSASPDREETRASNLWGRDGIVDGVPTTFGPAAIAVAGPMHNASDLADAKADRDRIRSKGSKRKRQSYKLSKSTFESTKRAGWEIPSAPESWRALEGSRRYRLMLTYGDMTVLTYEISRGVERRSRSPNELDEMD